MNNYFKAVLQAARETKNERFLNWLLNALTNEQMDFLHRAAVIYAEKSNSHKHGVMQAEGSDVGGAAVASSAVGKGVCGGDCTCDNVLDMWECTKQCYLPKQ